MCEVNETLRASLRELSHALLTVESLRASTPATARGQARATARVLDRVSEEISEAADELRSI
jgi:hypothetical protein